MRLFPSLLSVFLILVGVISASFIFAAEKIDINTALLEDLLKIIYIGEVRAKELISLRPFSSLNDLTRIKGIGEKSIEAIKKQGLAWVETNEMPTVEATPVSSNSTESSSNLTQSSLKQIVIVNEVVDLTYNKQMPKDRGTSLLVPAAIFTSLFGGVIILLLKKYVRT